MTALFEQQEETKPLCTCSYLQGPCGSHNNLYLCVQVSLLWLSHWAVILQSFTQQQCFSPAAGLCLFPHLLRRWTKLLPNKQRAELSLCFNAAYKSTSGASMATKLENSRVPSSSLFHLSLSLHISLTDIVERLQSFSLSLSLPVSLSLILLLWDLVPFSEERGDASSALYFNLAAVEIKNLKTGIHDFCISQIG